MTPEGKVKARVVKTLKKLEAYYFFPATGGYGRSGVADVIVCYRGLFIAIECKAGSNTPTALQDRELQKVRGAAGLALVINEDNVGDLEKIIREHLNLVRRERTYGKVIADRVSLAMSSRLEEPTWEDPE